MSCNKSCSCVSSNTRFGCYHDIFGVYVLILHPTTKITGRRDRITVGFTTTYAIRVVVSSNPAHGRVYSIQHYVALCLSVTCDRSVVFLLVHRFIFSNNKADRYNINEILLKITFNAPNPNSRFANFRF